MLRSSSRSAPGSVNKKGFARHFEGWQAGVVAVFIAGSMAALVVPRPVEPREVPDPQVDPRALAQIARRDDALAAEAERTPLDAEVRLLGSALRAFGRAESSAPEDVKQRARDETLAAAQRAFLRGKEPALALRAFQLRAFIAAVRTFMASGMETDDLVELGGLYRQRLEEARAKHEAIMDEGALRAAFKRRWSELTGIRGDAFAPAVEEERALARWLLHHPALPAFDANASPGLVKTYAEQFRLRKIDDLARIDASYPADLARGVVHFRLGQYAKSVEDFRRHLDGPLADRSALRAQNYLNAALLRGREDAF